MPKFHVVTVEGSRVPGVSFGDGKIIEAGPDGLYDLTQAQAATLTRMFAGSHKVEEVAPASPAKAPQVPQASFGSHIPASTHPGHPAHEDAHKAKGKGKK